MTISPKLARLAINENKQFSVTVTGTTNTAVDWIATGGNVINGLYTAGPNAGDFSITVRSQADPSKTDTAVIVIKKKTISLDPAEATILTAGQIRFKVIGLNNNEVTWTATGGTINQEGVYIAGDEAGDFKVGASSKADPSITAVAAVRINKREIKLSIDPVKRDVYINNTWQFEAAVSGTNDKKVTWSTDLGTIDKKSGLYTAPDNTAIGTAKVTATSLADRSVSATATVTIKQTKTSFHQWLATNTSEQARAMSIDDDGNIFLVGHMNSTNKGLFDNANHLGNSSDAFLVKYDKNLNYQWHIWLQSGGIDSGRAIATDSEGNVFVAVMSKAGLFDHQVLGSFDIFLVKYDKNGTKLWDKWIASDKSDRASYLITDKRGNVYLTGYTYGKLFNQENKGGSDIFVVKYSSDGGKLWNTSIASAQVDYAIALAQDGFDNLYISGQSEGNPDGGGVTGSDGFVIKFDSTGKEVWKQWYSTANYDGETAIAVDNSANLFVSVQSGGSLFEESKGGDDSYLIKYNSKGEELWHKQIASAKNDRARAVTTDNDGNAYVTGYTLGPLYNETPKGDRDIFVVKFDKNGNKIWNHALATDKFDYARAIVVNNATNRVYIAGYSEGDLLGEGSKGDFDAYVTSISQ